VRVRVRVGVRSRVRGRVRVGGEVVFSPSVAVGRAEVHLEGTERRLGDALGAS
jgi:hypothetical protein